MSPQTYIAVPRQNIIGAGNGLDSGIATAVVRGISNREEMIGEDEGRKRTTFKRAAESYGHTSPAFFSPVWTWMDLVV